MLVAFLIFLIVAIPFVELWVILLIADSLGGDFQAVLLTMLLLVADSLLGAFLLRSQGRTTWMRFTESVAAGKLPQREIIDGFLITIGGILLLTPGFVTDFFGLALLIPGSRKVVAGSIARRLERKLRVIRTASRTNPRRPDAESVEGDAVEVGAEFEYARRQIKE